MLVLPFDGRVEDAEYQLRHFSFLYRKVAGNGGDGRMICLDKGMDAETRTICELVCRDVPFMDLCTSAQLEKLI